MLQIVDFKKHKKSNEGKVDPAMVERYNKYIEVTDILYQKITVYAFHRKTLTNIITSFFGLMLTWSRQTRSQTVKRLFQRFLVEAKKISPRHKKFQKNGCS